MDKNTEFGGLQTSVKTYDVVTIELGPIRFYESIHLRIKALAEKYKTPLIEYLPSFDGQVAYLRGRQYKMTNLYPESDQSYDIDQEEKGKDPFVTELPKVTDIAWATWSEPIRIHAARNLQSLDDSDTMFTIMNKLMFPFGRNGNFYIMSNEIGLNSTWCDGSIENVDYFLHKKYNQNLFGPDML
jgi:hypothetical protein